MLSNATIIVLGVYIGGTRGRGVVGSSELITDNLFIYFKCICLQGEALVLLSMDFWC